MQRNKMDYSHLKVNSKWIKDLNVNETIKLLEETIGSKLSDTSFSNILGVISSQVRETKAKKQKQMGLYKTKGFVWQRKLSKKMKRPPIGWEEIFVNNISGKELRSNIYQELIQLNIKK